MEITHFDGLPIPEAVKILLGMIPTKQSLLKKGLPEMATTDPTINGTASENADPDLNPAHARLVKLVFNLFTKFADKVPEINYLPVMTLLASQLVQDEQTLSKAQRNADVNLNTLYLLDEAGQQLQSAALVAWETVDGLKNRMDADAGSHSQDFPLERITDFIYNTSGTLEEKLQSLLKIGQTLEDGVTLKAPAPPLDINTNLHFIDAVKAYDK